MFLNVLVYTVQLKTREDKLTFERIYLDYRDSMYRAANRILNNEQDAEDAVHQAFVSLVKHTARLRKAPPDSLYAFLVTVAQNKALDIIRSRAHFAPSAELEKLSSLSCDLSEKSAFSIALAGLNPAHREVLILRYVYGYSSKEAAEIMGINPDALRKLAERAKKQLRDKLEAKEETV